MSDTDIVMHLRNGIRVATVASVLALSGVWAGLARASDLMGYAANESGGTIVSVDLATGALGQPITVGSQPDAIAIAPSGPTAYVADYGSSSVVAVDLVSGAVTPAVSLPNAPSAIALSPDDRTAYVVSSDGVLVPVTLGSDSLGQAITVPAGSNAISISPDGTTAYVSDTSNGTVTAVPLAGTTGQPPAALSAPAPNGIVISPDGGTAYLTSASDESITPLNLSTGVAGPLIFVGYTPSGVALSPDGTTAYVSDLDDDVIIPVSLPTSTVGTPIALGIGPSAFALVPLNTTSETSSASPVGKRKSVKLGDQRLTLALTATASPAASTTGAGAGSAADACIARSSMLSASLARKKLRTGADLRFTRATFTLGNQTRRADAAPATVKLALTNLSSGRHTLSVRAFFSEIVATHGRTRRARFTFSRSVTQSVTIC